MSSNWRCFPGLHERLVLCSLRPFRGLLETKGLWQGRRTGDLLGEVMLLNSMAGSLWVRELSLITARPQLIDR